MDETSSELTITAPQLYTKIVAVGSRDLLGKQRADVQQYFSDKGIRLLETSHDIPQSIPHKRTKCDYVAYEAWHLRDNTCAAIEYLSSDIFGSDGLFMAHYGSNLSITLSSKIEEDVDRHAKAILELSDLFSQ